MRKLKPTSLSREINALPFRVRIVFSAVMFSEAAMLLYLLATLFPVELHIYTITTINEKFQQQRHKRQALLGAATTPYAGKPA
ncbi:MAG: hypothetical protein QXN24_03325 [Candidatus Bathyarchaeia archaeon]